MDDMTKTIAGNTDISHLVDGLTCDPQTWQDSSLVSVTQITPSGLTLLYSRALQMRSLVKSKGGSNKYEHKILSSIFYEPSTRTSCSFQSAMMRLGGKVIHIDAGADGNSSASKKGETLNDTIRCLQCYTDLTVLRHGVVGTVADVVVSNGGVQKPVVNAGDGVGEHPTQALLDLFTIVDELNLVDSQEDEDTSTMEPLVIVLVGDLKHGRTVHSLAKLLARVQSKFLKRQLVLRYCSPSTLAMPKSIKDYVTNYAEREGYDIVQEEYLSSIDADSDTLAMHESFMDYIADHAGGVDRDIMNDTDADAINRATQIVHNAIKNANVLYVTRVQKERFSTLDDYAVVKGAYIIDKRLMAIAPRKMIVMHPLPRVDEIKTEVDSDPRAAYFRQMENGMYVRMAILDLILGGDSDN